MGDREGVKDLERGVGWRIKYVINELGISKEKDDSINRYTRMRIGPPSFLEENDKKMWEEKIEKAREECRKEILLPRLYDKMNTYRKRMYRHSVDARNLIEVSREVVKRWSGKLSRREWNSCLERARLDEWIRPPEPRKEESQIGDNRKEEVKAWLRSKDRRQEERFKKREKEEQREELKQVKEEADMDIRRRTIGLGCRKDTRFSMGDGKAGLKDRRWEDVIYWNNNKGGNIGKREWENRDKKGVIHSRCNRAGEKGREEGRDGLKMINREGRQRWGKGRWEGKICKVGKVDVSWRNVGRHGGMEEGGRSGGIERRKTWGEGKVEELRSNKREEGTERWTNEEGREKRKEVSNRRSQGRVASQKVCIEDYRYKEWWMGSRVDRNNDRVIQRGMIERYSDKRWGVGSGRRGKSEERLRRERKAIRKDGWDEENIRRDEWIVNRRKIEDDRDLRGREGTDGGRSVGMEEEGERRNRKGKLLDGIIGCERKGTRDWGRERIGKRESGIERRGEWRRSTRGNSVLGLELRESKGLECRVVKREGVERRRTWERGRGVGVEKERGRVRLLGHRNEKDTRGDGREWRKRWRDINSNAWEEGLDRTNKERSRKEGGENRNNREEYKTRGRAGGGMREEGKVNIEGSSRERRKNKQDSISKRDEGEVDNTAGSKKEVVNLDKLDARIMDTEGRGGVVGMGFRTKEIWVWRVKERLQGQEVNVGLGSVSNRQMVGINVGYGVRVGSEDEGGRIKKKGGSNRIGINRVEEEKVNSERGVNKRWIEEEESKEEGIREVEKDEESKVDKGNSETGRVEREMDELSEKSWYVDCREERVVEEKGEEGESGGVGLEDEGKNRGAKLEGKQEKLKKRQMRLLRKYKKVGRLRKELKEKGSKDRKGDVNKWLEGVVDMTREGISIEEKRVLSLGKSYVILDNSIDKDRLQADISGLMRKIRLRYMGRLAILKGGKEEEKEVERGESKRSERQEEEVEEEREERRGRISSNDGERRKREGGDLGEMRWVVKDIEGKEIGRVIGRQEEGDEGRLRVRERVRIIEGRNSKEDGMKSRVMRGESNSEGEVSGRMEDGNGSTKDDSGLGEDREEEIERSRRRAERERRLGGRIKSTYIPEVECRKIDELERSIETEIVCEVKKGGKVRDNLSKKERRALNGLRKRVKERKITVTQADKGGGIVVLDYVDYVRKGDKYIQEEAKAYSLEERSEMEVISEIRKERDRVADKLKRAELIDVKVGTYIKHQIRERVTGLKFYMKIHKSLDREIVPVRPLQSCIHSPVHHLAIVLNDIVMPYIRDRYLRTFIRDSNSMLHLVENLKVEGQCSMYTADVSALYPSIPHELGLEAMRDFIRQNRVVEEGKQLEAFMEGVRLVITQNFMKWKGKIYRQSSGVAMGTPLAVAYANIFMGYVDNILKDRCNYLREFRRYIDDNWFLVPKDREADFEQALGELGVEGIKYTREKLEEGGEIAFLDISLSMRDGGKISTRLYTKPTDGHLYLLPTSFHPRQITKSIPYGVFSRIRRLCKVEKEFEEDSGKAKSWLVARGYEEEAVEKCRREVGSMNRWEMIEKIERRWVDGDRVEEEKNNKGLELLFVCDYSTIALRFRRIFEKHKKTIEDIMQEEGVGIKVVYRKRRSLGDLIIQPGLRLPIEGGEEGIDNKKGKFVRCGLKLHRTSCKCGGRHGVKECRMCIHSEEELDFCTQRLKGELSCGSRNVIYVIWCSICKMKYVGETRQPVRERFVQHLNNIRKGEEAVYVHFREHGGENIKIGILENLNIDDVVYRRVREGEWIKKLDTCRPRGLNSQTRDSPLNVLEEEESLTRRRGGTNM